MRPVRVLPPALLEESRACAQRLHERGLRQDLRDPIRGNRLLPLYGANVLKGLCRTHPRVVQRHHPELRNWPPQPQRGRERERPDSRL